MEENNRKGPGVFYAVMGVATLVVAIIGATFAFFSIGVNTDGVGEITGTTAAGVGLTLTVKNTTNVAGSFVPLDTYKPFLVGGDNGTSQMNAALQNDVKCTDDANNAVCNVYRVEISGTDYGTTALNVIGKLKIDVVKKGTETSVADSNIKWKLITGSETGTDDVVYTFSDNTGATVNPSDGSEAFITANGNNGEVLNTGTPNRVYYLVVWLEEAGSDQGTPDANLSFTGTVTFNAVDTSGTGSSANLTATFTGA